MNATFGPAGNSDSFLEKYGALADVPAYINEMGLDVFEYQCGRGVKIKTATAASFGALAAEGGVTLSLHAPYYISLSSTDRAKRENSVNYIRQSAEALKAMGGKRIILHSGSCGTITRAEALALALESLKWCVDMLDAEGYGDMTLCPETMGKVNQLGSLDEVIALCKIDERIVPCIDFGHLNARDGGAIKTKDDYAHILDRLDNELGTERGKSFHSHFSKIEYGDGGEKRHLTFADERYGPDYRPLMELVAARKLSPVFICESDGTQAEDALAMKQYYLSVL